MVQRSGRIDRAIEVPVPDADGRACLVRPYGEGLRIAPRAFADLVARSEGVSAAFIKEIAWRLAQPSLIADHPGRIEADDLDTVLEEMLSERDGLNLWLLGGAAGAVAR